MAGVQPLVAVLDRYGGRIVDGDALPADAAEFAARLEHSVAAWKADGARGLWLKLPAAASQHLPAALAQGFDLHHADAGGAGRLRHADQVAAGRRGEPPAPVRATSYLGIGGFVLREDTNEVLVVSERYATLSSGPGVHWKCPGGLVDKGESLGDAAAREVFEETGIRCKFERMVMYRHKHNYVWGCDDIYFVAKMRPTTFEIKADPREIASCRWMPLAELLKDECVNPLQQAAMQLASEPRASAGMQQRTVIGGADFKFGPEWPRYRPQTVYHAPADLALEDARERGAFPCVVDEGGGNEQTSSGRVAEKL